MEKFADKTAIIIEDDETSIKVLDRFLKQLGIQSQVIRDSGDSEKLLQQAARPDVIFLDLEMPHNSGYAVLNMINAISALQGVPVAGYTTHISHLNAARQAGFHSFVGKPLDVKLFPSQLARILSGTPVWEVPE